MRIRRTKRQIITFAYNLLLITSAYYNYVMGTHKARVRRFKVRPINRRRDSEEHYATLVRDMRLLEADMDQYFKYTRMSPELFEHLLELVGPRLQKDVTKNPLSPAHRLTMTLHYLAEGCSMQQIAWCFRVGKATVHIVLKETCQVLWDVLGPLQLPKPTTEQFESTVDGYFKRWNMPNCFGSVDGKHVMIQSPKYSGSEFFCYKKQYSLVLMASCDAYYRFTMVDIGAAGSSHDSVVFQESGFGHALLNGKLDLPPAKCLPRTCHKMEHFVVADQAFPLHKNIMRPYPGSNLGETKNIFNYRLSRARRTIENTFGIFVQRWRILRKPIIASIDVCEKIVMATVVLHNFLQRCEEDMPMDERKYCPTGFADFIDENHILHLGTWREEECNLRSVRRLGSNNAKRSVILARDNLAEYFSSSVGAVSWQWDHISRGAIPADI